MSSPNDIAAATRWDIDRLSSLIVSAMFDSPLATWLVPTFARRDEVLTDVVEIWVSHARTASAVGRGERADPHELVLTNTDRDSVCVWLNQPDGAPHWPKDYHVQLMRAASEFLPRFAALDDVLSHAALQEPHHRLLFFATHPSVQRKGKCGALMFEHVLRLEEADLLARADVLDGPARRWLRTHGFADYATPFTLPDGPTLFPMVRRPMQ